MQEPVIERFINAIRRLLEDKIANSQKEIAETLSLSSSYFTELMKKRINLSADHVQNFLISWPVNPSYIFSLSDEIYRNTPSTTSELDSVNEPSGTYTPSYKTASPRPKTAELPRPTHYIEELLTEKDRVISTQREALEAQKQTIQLLLANSQAKEKK
ncbi:hypothetical protein [uncultured Roseivirga sp.]|uniref:hypothetical protein n=1 Tax=uncultured Roseivirga sp. TaxID=543088 RepID=UPI0030DC26B5|tara:strand:+ start:118347 stop:118820 length:474 start_codon:yes stop_codon:yes gene_type:complete